MHMSRRPEAMRAGPQRPTRTAASSAKGRRRLRSEQSRMYSDDSRQCEIGNEINGMWPEIGNSEMIRVYINACSAQ